jgi:hypothetical protein
MLEGLGGGIVQMPPNLSASEQSMGSGFTVYYFVDSIDEVSRKLPVLIYLRLIAGTDEWH